MEIFVTRQPPTGEKDDYEGENFWISEGLPNRRRRRRRGNKKRIGRETGVHRSVDWSFLGPWHSCVGLQGSQPEENTGTREVFGWVKSDETLEGSSSTKSLLSFWRWNVWWIMENKSIQILDSFYVISLKLKRSNRVNLWSKTGWLITMNRIS